MTGFGQGGWLAQRLQAAIGSPIDVAYRSPIPLETDLEIVGEDDRWRVIDPGSPETTIVDATRWSGSHAPTEPVSLDDARRASLGFPLEPHEHPAPHCFSCGYGPASMGVMSGPLGDGRWANAWRVPDWATRPDGSVDEAAIWAAADCAAGWYVACEGSAHRASVTVQLSVEVVRPLAPNAEYALVSWNGGYPPAWDGRKRGAAAALFDDAGRCVARSTSFWLAS